MSDKIDIKSMNYDELEQFVVTGLKDKKFRARQIYDWLHVKLARSFDEMSNLSKALREKLADQCELTALSIVKCYVSEIDGTRKYLLRLSDGNIIESVLMKYKHGNSVCVSSQVGCRMGCRFCASTLDGLARNMTASEMLDADLCDTKRVSMSAFPMWSSWAAENLWIIMIMLFNLLKCLSDENGLNISQRNITLSTCGTCTAHI